MVIHDVLGVKPNQWFRVKGTLSYDSDAEYSISSMGRLNVRGALPEEFLGKSASEALLIFLEEKQNIVKNWEPSEDELCVIKGMHKAGYTWFARHGTSIFMYKTCFFSNKPERTSFCKEKGWGGNDEACILKNDFFKDIGTETCYKCEDYI